MKVNRSNPVHWLYLAAFSLNVLCALLLRRLPTKRSHDIVLYGHKFSGNLKALYSQLNSSQGLNGRVTYLSLDPAHVAQLRRQGVNVVSAVGPAASLLLARSAAIITDHGLHVMEPLLRFTDIRFFDVWHGIPFKGFDAEDFRVQRQYEEVWVASPLLADLYARKFGFEPARVAVTGYARTDRLARPAESVMDIRRKIGAPSTGPLVLFAPTWVQDDKGRSLYPFGCSETEFLLAISEVAACHGGTVLMRAHLNSGVVGDGWPNVLSVPQSRFPDTEAVLLAADVLVCDWSSIAFDYLVLERPTIFLDVPAPFAKGFSLGPEYRFGPVVPSLAELVVQLDRVLGSPEYVHTELLPQLKVAKEAVYEGYADGLSAQRCAERLVKKLPTA